MKNFQLVTIIVFMALAVFGILVFSGVLKIGGSDAPGSLGTVVLWGTVKGSTMGPLLEEFNDANPAFVLQYVQKEEASFDQELLEALAEGRGPDIIFLPDSLAFHYANKIAMFPFESYPLSVFKNNFAGASEVFLTSKGILAFPLSIDPMVMYYNRSQLDASGIVSPPFFWDDLTSLVPKLTKKDESNKIIKSAVALGHFSNIAHAKIILSALFIQAGNKIVTEKDGVWISNLNSTGSGGENNLASVLKFYTDFADPSKDVYSWNRSFPNSGDAFSREDLAFYFGFASELVPLINKNPNQNLAVTFFPQKKSANFKSTGAKVMGIAVLSSSRNPITAFTVASLLATGSFASKFALAEGVAPARRDLLKIKPADAYSPVFYDSALYARSWIDPSPEGTDRIFRSIIEGVIANSMTPVGAIADANSKLDLLLRK